jgi:hypothetical protein
MGPRLLGGMASCLLFVDSEHFLERVCTLTPHMLRLVGHGWLLGYLEPARRQHAAVGLIDVASGASAHVPFC